MQSTAIVDAGARPLISGVSVAVEAGDDAYVGSFEAERVLRLTRAALTR